MNASQYLKNHGWQGTGHSLDGNGRGLKKPLLVSKKVDVLGVGLDKHAAVTGQWWLNAYDQGLKNLGSGKESTLAQAQRVGVNRAGLYTRFVKGEGMPGSIGQTILPTEVKAVVEAKKTSDSGMLPTPQDSDAQEEKADRKRKRSEKPEEKKSKQKMDSIKEKKTGSAGTDSDDKAAKKAKKEANKAAKGTKSGTTTADASGAEEELDSEKRALYTKRAAEKGVSLETYIKRRQEKYAAKKDEKRK